VTDERGIVSPSGDIHPLARLLRGFATDFLSSHDLSVVPRIMCPDYCLSIGGHLLNGRDDEYLPPTAAQLDQFPGLNVTVHDVVLGENALAMQFTEHGASRQHGGRGAAWRGITLFETDGERLWRGWAEEDYFARKRQLASGICDSVDAPHSMPWDAKQGSPNIAAEELARQWLGQFDQVVRFPCAKWMTSDGPQPEDLIVVESTDIDALFSAGDRIAFHLQHQGAYRGGFDDVKTISGGQSITLRAAGLLTVRNGEVVHARITWDRLGLHRELKYGR
jgi:hypothetical protein